MPNFDYYAMSARQQRYVDTHGKSKEIKMDSPFAKKTVFSADYNDVEKLINEYFPKLNGKYEIPCSEECNNDVTLEYDLDGNLSTYDERGIEAGEEMYMTRTYLNKLVSVGTLEAGTYIIRVSW